VGNQQTRGGDKSKKSKGVGVKKKKRGKERRGEKGRREE